MSMFDMYVLFTGIQNGEPVHLARSLSVLGLEVALCEPTYYHHWDNINEALENNEVETRDATTRIRDGYYNVCELDEDVFQPLDAELSLHAPTGRLQLSAKKNLRLKCQLAQLLGFPRRMFEPGKIYIAAKPHRLAVHREICVHLAEVSTSEDLHNVAPPHC